MANVYNNIIYAGTNGVWYVEKRAMILWVNDNEADVYVGINKIGKFNIYSDQSPSERFSHSSCHWAMLYDQF